MRQTFRDCLHFSRLLPLYAKVMGEDAEKLDDCVLSNIRHTMIKYIEWYLSFVSLYFQRSQHGHLCVPLSLRPSRFRSMQIKRQYTRFKIDRTPIWEKADRKGNLCYLYEYVAEAEAHLDKLKSLPIKFSMLCSNQLLASKYGNLWEKSLFFFLPP